MKPIVSLEGRVIVVTGAGQGIGKAVTELVIELGGKVVAVDLNGETLRAALAALPAEHAMAVVGSVADPSVADARRRPAWTPAAAFDTADDLDGAVIAGGAGDCVEGLQRWVDRGVRHLVLDLRFMADDFETAVELLATDVLPRLRAQPTTAARP